jgi:SpoVK/Ycf46/Vps4 family AAA+-type ATPase
VFLAATANQIDRLPPELLRKGRFDEIFFVDLPNPRERQEIFAIHLRRRQQRPENFGLGELVAATEGFSGAEIEQVVIASLYQTLERRQPLDTAGLLREIQRTVPLAVSRREEIDRLRAFAADRFVPVTSPLVETALSA